MNSLYGAEPAFSALADIDFVMTNDGLFEQLDQRQGTKIDPADFQEIGSKAENFVMGPRLGKFSNEKRSYWERRLQELLRRKRRSRPIEFPLARGWRWAEAEGCR